MSQIFMSKIHSSVLQISGQLKNWAS